MINPMPLANEWPQIDFEPILPPIARVRVGRQKKARKSATNEPQDANRLRRTCDTIRSSNFHEWGHNSQGCKTAINPNR